MNFTVNRSDGQFTPIDIRTAWRAFKSYWLVCHDTTTCEVTKITLGPDIDVIFPDRKLKARTKSSDKYRPVISVKDELYVGIFAKMLHFYFNPSNSKQLSSTSKIGLALARMTGHRYDHLCKILDHRIIDVIISIQGFAESYAQKEIRKENKLRKSQTEKDIQLVVAAIKKVPHMSEHVKEFYLKDVDTIREVIDRPSFKRAIEITADKLSVDLGPYSNALAVMEIARRQVVHSQDYDAQYLINLGNTPPSST